MPTNTTATALPPLVASLREEAKKAGVNYDFRDPAFARKLENLARQVPREYDIVLAFRAFCADPNRAVSPFWFCEKFDKYARQVPRQTPAPQGGMRESLYVECPRCHSQYQRARPQGCNYCQEHPAGLPADPRAPWEENAHV